MHTASHVSFLYDCGSAGIPSIASGDNFLDDGSVRIASITIACSVGSVIRVRGAAAVWIAW
jgi:hypothetical protein